jgi:2-phospho-L-lactate guanylyltransferase
MTGHIGERRAPATLTWTIVVPLKALPDAKSRLAAASNDPAAHADLVAAIRADTLAAAAANGRVLLVVDRLPAAPADWPVLVQTGPGLNQALREAADYVHDRWPSDAIAALVGDLPALRAAALATALELAGAHPQAYVADASGLGTTLLTALPGHPLDPAFGLGSASRHGRAAVALPADPGLRLDVDTAADLDLARQLGLGPATAALFGDIAR